MEDSTGINPPHAAQPTSFGSLGSSLWRNRQLIVQMTRREVVGRYRGSVMGLAWHQRVQDGSYRHERSGERA